MSIITNSGPCPKICRSNVFMEKINGDSRYIYNVRTGESGRAFWRRRASSSGLRELVVCITKYPITPGTTPHHAANAKKNGFESLVILTIHLQASLFFHSIDIFPWVKLQLNEWFYLGLALAVWSKDREAQKRDLVWARIFSRFSFGTFGQGIMASKHVT